MKKVILILAFVTGTISSVFASDEKVNNKVLEAFRTEFSEAKEVNWTSTANYYKAEFTFSGQRVNAYYTTDGELLALARYITRLDLPIKLQASLKKNYPDYWVSDLFEVSICDNTGYYITIENADTMIVLKAGINDWSVYKRVNKS